MQVNTLSIQHLFEKDIQYRVPLYQRPYVWNEEEQWQYLWEDIRRLAETNIKLGETNYHFLGATVQDIQTVPPGTQEVRLIIDGQQRLTTLQIIMKAFYDVTNTHLNEPYVAATRRLAFNNHPLSKEQIDAYKVWPTNADRSTFQKVMEVRSPKELFDSFGKRTSTSNLDDSIADAYLYFYENLLEWVGKEGDETRINAMYVTLRERLRLVVIDLDQGDDAQMIFETLNARGTPLLAADLVKNSLLAEIEKNGQSSEQAYQRYWKPFDLDQEFWRVETGQGHARRARIEGLMRYSISLMSRQESPTSELYTAYKRFSRLSSAGTAIDRMKAFSRYGEIYRRIIEGVPEKNLTRFFYRLEVMSVGTAFPLLIMLFDDHKDDFDLLGKICSLIDSFLIRRMICRLPTRGYNLLFFDLVDRLRDSTDPVKATNSRLREGQGEGERWPDDREFLHAWLNNRLYSQLTRGRVRIILEALEEEMRSERAEDKDCPRNLTIEHIMPQTWEPNWPLPHDRDNLEEKMKRDQLIHTIGNLTLLTDKFNKEQSNMAWIGVDGKSGKREAMRKQTVLHLNKMVADSEEWNEVTISERGESLFELARSLWKK